MLGSKFKDLYFACKYKYPLKKIKNMTRLFLKKNSLKIIFILIIIFGLYFFLTCYFPLALILIVLKTSFNFSLSALLPDKLIEVITIPVIISLSSLIVSVLVAFRTAKVNMYTREYNFASSISDFTVNNIKIRKLPTYRASLNANNNSLIREEIVNSFDKVLKKENKNSDDYLVIEIETSDTSIIFLDIKIEGFGIEYFEDESLLLESKSGKMLKIEKYNNFVSFDEDDKKYFVFFIKFKKENDDTVQKIKRIIRGDFPGNSVYIRYKIKLHLEFYDKKLKPPNSVLLNINSVFSAQKDTQVFGRYLENI